MPEDPNPFAQPETPAIEEPSIVDTILDLDELLSSDVRRAEKTARFSIRPDLEGDLDELEYELEQLTDGQGNALDAGGDASLGDGVPGAVRVAERYQATQAEYAASFRSVRVRQLPSDEWMAFENKHRDSLEKGAPYPEAMWDELISKCAIAPEMKLDKVRALRKKIGHPQMNHIAMSCWAVNTASGVSIPKSQLSSRVLKRRRPEQS